MDKVAIVETYGFIGFGLCEKLLEMGIQVDGYRFLKEEDEEFVNDKKFLVGRNANFTERKFEEILIEDDTFFDGEMVIVISLYDLFFQASNKNTDKNIMINLMNRYHKPFIKKIVCIVPYNFLFEIPPFFNEQLNFLTKENKPLQMIYLPTIYGPWQPSVFLFQQFINQHHSQNKPHIDERELTDDAIFIDDAVEEMIYQIGLPDKTDVLLKSSNPKQWLEGANYLGIEVADSINSKDKKNLDNRNVKAVFIKGKNPISQGLDLQRKHYLSLFSQL